MKTQFSLLSTLFCLLLLWVVSCKKTDDPVVAKSSEKTISTFAFNGLTPAVTATVDATAKTVMATVPYGTDVTKLVPTITFSAKATVLPATGVAQDFTKAVIYTVTAEDGSAQTYTVAVGVGTAPKSPAKDIKTFTFASLSPAVAATIDATAKTISATVASGTDVIKLVPTIALSDKATVSPATGVAQDFTKAVTYTVTAEDGSTQAYTANVTVAKPVASAFSYNETIYSGQSALNLSDGTLKKFDLLPLTTSADGDYLFSATSLYSTASHGVVTFIGANAFDYGNATPKWTTNFPVEGFRKSALVDGVIYSGSYDISADKVSVIAINASSGAKKWTYDVGNGFNKSLSLLSNPVIANGLCYVAYIKGVVAIDVATGAKKWETAYTLTGNSYTDLIFNSNTVYVAHDKLVTAYDAQTGKQKWESTSPKNTVISLTSSSDQVFVTDNGSIYALDLQTGTQKWVASGKVYSDFLSTLPPVFSNGYVITRSTGKIISLLDATTGTEKNVIYQLSNNIRAIVAVNNVVYVQNSGTDNKDYVFAHNMSDGLLKWQSPAINASSTLIIVTGNTVYDSPKSGMVQ